MPKRVSKSSATTGGNPRPSAEWRRAKAVFDEVQQTLRRRQGVTGVDIGPERAGEKHTGRIAIRVHVQEKVELKSLSGNRRLPDAIQGVPVDVVTNAFRVCACSTKGAKFRMRRDPLFGGFAIGPSGTTEMGTMAIVVVDTDDIEHLLTCAHVVEDQVGLDVVQPHGATAPHEIGRVTATAWNKDMDAAVVQLNGQRTAGAGVYSLGVVQPVPLEVPSHWLNITVAFAGACSGKRRGKLVSTSFAGKIDSPWGSTTVVDHLVIESLDGEPMGRRGDSGALVVFEDQAIGMVRAVSQDAAGTILASKLSPILDHFGVAIAP